MHEVRRDRLEKMFRGMVAFQVEIERIEGKFKLSQNRPDYDVQKLIGILESTGDPHLTYAAGLMRVNLAMGKNEEFGSNFTTQYAA
jgi:transcriptional regulator